MSTRDPVARSRNPEAGPDDEKRQVIGLVANGSSGPWDIAIDEAIAQATRWFAQVEGPGVYLYFEIPSLKIVDRIIKFIKRQVDANKRLPSGPVAGNGSLRLGYFGRTPVALLWDEEDKNRCFFTIGTAIKPTLRITLSAGDLDDLVKALGQVRDDLEAEGLLSPRKGR